MQDAKEEVRERLNIEDVIGEYVQLKRAGRNFRGLSPFSSEKTPSFYVSPDKHIWHDFSSNKGGDVFSFIMEVEGIDFKTCLEMLARKAGVDLSLYNSFGDQNTAKLKKRMHQAHDLAATYYQKSLISNQHAIEYVFKKRQLSKEIVQDFKIGYAPSVGDALVKFLEKKGFLRSELSRFGLTNRFGGDLFRGRITIPLMDGTGQIIGFTGRIIVDDDKSPKYLNTPQTLIYDKSRHVFGLSQAKEAIRRHDYAVVVEGNMDVISSHQVGVKQVVATAGTAMTEHHLKALARLTNNIKLSFDGDKAGLAATERAIPIAQAVGVDLSIISMPDDVKDPDELIKKDQKLWLKAIENSVPAVDWVIDQYAKRNDLNSAIGKRKFTSMAIEIIKALKDSVEREYYIKKVAEKSDSSFDAVNEKVIDRNPDKVERAKKVMIKADKERENNYYQDNLLAVAMIDGAVRDLLKDVDLDMIDGDERKAVLELIKNYGQKVIEQVPKELQKYDTYVKILLLKADARYAQWSDSDRYFETARLLRQIRNDYKKIQKEKILEQLRDAEILGDDEQTNKIRIQMNQIIKEIKDGAK